MSPNRSPQRLCILRHYGYDLLVQREAETLRQAGFDVDVICLRMEGGPTAPIINDVRIHYIPLERRKGGIGRYLFDYLSFFLAAAGMVTWLHLRRPFAAIQVNNMPDFLVFATLIPRLLGAKITLVMYEPTPELWATKYDAPRFIRLLEAVEQMSLRYAHAVFAVTEPMKQLFVARGTPAEKIHVMLNAPAPHILLNAAHTPRQKPDGSFTLICHGAIEERYGHDTILQAVQRARVQIPGLRLRIMGRGSYLNEFLAQTKALRLEEHVHYLGFVPLADMVAELQSADVGIVAQKSSPYSHLVHTGKMYDYLTFGLPVLASRLRAVEAYFGDDSLYYFTPGDPDSLAQGIVDLYEHPEKRQALIERSQELYRRYRWEQQRETYLAVYRELVR